MDCLITQEKWSGKTRRLVLGIFRKFALVNKEGTTRVFRIPKRYVPVPIQWELLLCVLR